MHIERTVEIEADPAEVWELLVDDDERADWFGGPTTLEPVPGGGGTFTDPDGTRRTAVVEEAEPGRRLAWTWRRDDPSQDGGDDGASRVAIDLEPIVPARPGAPLVGTRVTVTETAMTTAASPATGRPDRGGLDLGGLDLGGLELRAVLRAGSPTRALVA